MQVYDWELLRPGTLIRWIGKSYTTAPANYAVIRFTHCDSEKWYGVVIDTNVVNASYPVGSKWWGYRDKNTGVHAMPVPKKPLPEVPISIHEEITLEMEV